VLTFDFDEFSLKPKPIPELPEPPGLSILDLYSGKALESSEPQLLYTASEYRSMLLKIAKESESNELSNSLNHLFTPFSV
jgi:hypothetical protein